MESKDKILFVIMHGINCKERYDNIIKTWGKDINYIFYSDYDDESKNIIKTTNDHSYFGLEEKMINAVKVVYNNFNNYEWFFFCDDDTYVNSSKLILELSNFNDDFVYGQVLPYGYRKNPDLIFCSGGAGILIHKKNLEKIQNTIKNHNIGIADVSFFMTLESNNIGVVNSDFFYNDTPSSKNLDNSDYKNYITFHNIKTLEQMEHIHGVITNL